MTDLEQRPDAGHGDTATDDTDAAQTYAWAPVAPKARKNRSALWIGLPAGATAVALVAASLVLIAPGASVAGVAVGGLTPGAAADAISAHLAATELVIDGADGPVTVTGADLGARVDAAAAAEAAFADNPMWNPSSWFPGSVRAEVSLDPALATPALRSAAAELYVDPVDAVVAFDAASASYVVTDAVPGKGIDLAVVRDALQGAFDAGATSAEVDADVVAVDATVTTDEAAETAASMNGMLDAVGFYVGDERTVAVDRAVAASWLTIDDVDGALRVSAAPSAIQPVVDALSAQVDRAAVDATVITDSSGAELSAVTPGVVGRTLGSTDGIADRFATMLAEGQAAFPLTVQETPFTTTKLARTIDVDLSAQRTVLYENGQVVQSWAISSGLGENATPTGNFRIGWKTAKQGMGNPDLSKPPYYYTPNVPWVSYFNGDVAFHGTYWHDNFGSPMSHGCINMPIDAAKFVYDWAPKGVEVSVHY